MVVVLVDNPRTHTMVKAFYAIIYARVVVLLLVTHCVIQLILDSGC